MHAAPDASLQQTQTGPPILPNVFAQGVTIGGHGNAPVSARLLPPMIPTERHIVSPRIFFIYISYPLVGSTSVVGENRLLCLD